jgi:hypothetical protein
MFSASGWHVGEGGQRTQRLVVVVRAKDAILQWAPDLVCFLTFFHPVPPHLTERARFDEHVWHVFVFNALYYVASSTHVSIPMSSFFCLITHAAYPVGAMSLTHGMR